jgi:hypothetical protein
MNWLAFKVQHPGVKINHALVLGGDFGVGKDTIITPARYAVGVWNRQEANPGQVMWRFNGYLRAVILRVSEAHDLGDSDRFKFYEHMKSYIAAPPEFHRIDEKNIPEPPVPNVVGVIITTNHKTDGLYLPAGDRRHYVAWCDLEKDDPTFADGYFDKLHRYYDDSGNAAVAAYLRQRDISKFNPKLPPQKTPAFWAMVEAGADPDQGDLADLLDRLGNPEAVTLGELQQIGRQGVNGDFADWLADRKNRRTIPHKMEASGYTPVRNDAQTDGRWKVAGKNCAIYVLKSLGYPDQLRAARALAGDARSCPPGP